jgi:serine/threonine protein kinase
MAPELSGGNQSYAGPPVDIFALGQMLFLLKNARFAFMESRDIHYRRIIKHPAKAMKAKGFMCDEEFLDLFVGLIQSDPA